MKRKPVLTAAIYIGYLLLFVILFKAAQPIEVQYHALMKQGGKFNFAVEYYLILDGMYLLFGVLLGLPRLVMIFRAKGRLGLNPVSLFLIIPSLFVPVYYYLEMFGFVSTDFLYNSFGFDHIGLMIVLFGFSLTMLVKKEESRRR
jgi:hypothetical protein